MTHEQILADETAESYVRGRLSASERAAFEDHCYACDECFEQVQVLQKFVDGVREAANTGALAAPRPQGASFRVAFALAMAASLVLTVLAGWTTLIETPRLREEAEAARTRAAELERNLAATQLALARPAQSEPNLPLVMLEASRADTPGAVTVPQTAGGVALWVEPPPSPAGTKYRLEIRDRAGNPVETLEGLVRNGYGALAASVPASRLLPGTYQARLYSMEQGKLVGDYRFDIRR